MAYHRQEEVQRLIINLAMWNGDGESVRGCSSEWGRIVREVRKGWRSSFTIPAIGVDAAPTKAALEAIGETFSSALWTYYLSSLTFEMQAAEVLGIAKSTYHRRLEIGHTLFINAYNEALDRQRFHRVHSYANQQSGQSPLTPPSSDLPPLPLPRALDEAENYD
jgi:hypothetical protein